MIFGIGVDILRRDRVERVYQRFGHRFVDRLLMDEERALFEEASDEVRFLTMRFAAKEAIVKALGTGFGHGMWIRDAGVVPDAWGRPEVVFSGRGRRRCEELGAGQGHVTLTDEAGLVVAVAILMRLEAPTGPP